MPVPSHDKLGGCNRKGIQRINGGDDEGGGINSPDGMAFSHIFMHLPLLSSPAP